MKQVTFKDEIVKVDGKYQYGIRFSDNPYDMVFKGRDMMECLEIKSILGNRIEKFFSGKSNELRTSDLGFEYIKQI